ncbi:membrane-bound alkaline phosphatase-like [Uranotaenia lowii]|uniref:membrane-bound alkaline phosphatase-like n=1 Tax=Uranotaenia lowii TaxID=190385 RepID=UPI00247A24E4|nr:membrane-bound alkaline phosphatase-like [Uranotaenia lowii]
MLRNKSFGGGSRFAILATLLGLGIFLQGFGDVVGHEEHDPHYWQHQAHELLFEKKDYTMQKINIAKNIMVFVGSGMSQATITAARTINGGDNETFAFENLKWSGNARTYCVDSRVPDSACASTAFLTGVKSNVGTVAMHPQVKRKECVPYSDKTKQLESIAKWALDAGKAVGFATTSRVTAGSNAALYANSADKDWENDGAVSAAGCNPTEVRDIAYQLVHGDIGKHFKVILGGGRKNFIPTSEIDKTGARGLRADGKNLIDEWKKSKTGNAVYIHSNFELKCKIKHKEIG